MLRAYISAVVHFTVRGTYVRTYVFITKLQAMRASVATMRRTAVRNRVVSAFQPRIADGT